MPSKLSGAISISRILLSFSHAARCLASRPFHHRKKPRSKLAHKTSRLLLQAERMRLQITRHNVSLSLYHARRNAWPSGADVAMVRDLGSLSKDVWTGCAKELFLDNGHNAETLADGCRE